jgi:hypothetical protein
MAAVTQKISNVTIPNFLSGLGAMGTDAYPKLKVIGEWGAMYCRKLCKLFLP